MADGRLDPRDTSEARKPSSLADSIRWMDQAPAQVGSATKLQVSPTQFEPVSAPGAPGTPAQPSKDIPGSNPGRENHHGGWPVRRTPEMPGIPIGPGAGPGTGPTDVPGPIIKPTGTEEEIRDSVYFNANGRTLMLAGGLTGAATNLSVWKLDKVTGLVRPEERAGWVKCWRDNFSPSQAVVPERMQGLQIATDRLRLKTSAFGLWDTSLNNRVLQRDRLADAYRLQTPVGTLPEIERKFFQDRVDLIRDNGKFTRANILANAGTEAEVASRTKLFTTVEGTALVQQADRYWQTVNKRGQALDCMRSAQCVKDNAASYVAQAERGSITTPGSTLLKGLGQGIGIATLTVGADLALDKAMGNDPALKPYSSWGVQGIGLPLVLMSKMGTPGKIVGALGVVGVSHLMDRSMGAPTGMFSTFARPNVPETVLITASALAPIRDWRIKTGLIAGSWVAGRAYNLLNDRYEFEGKTQAKLQNDARIYVDIDKQERSESSFKEAVARTARFARENESAATFALTDWQAANTASSMLEMQRGRAALLTGLGAVRLEKGTRIDRNTYDSGDRVLVGKNYDLGGEAANLLRTAHSALKDAQGFARANNGRSFNGRSITDTEIAQYDTLKAHVQVKLDVIYGEHDMDAVVNELQSRVTSQGDDMRRFGEELKDFGNKLTDQDPEFKGKIMRDLAVLHIAFARAAADSGTKREHFANAATYVERARVLDRSSKDLAKIAKML